MDVSLYWSTPLSRDSGLVVSPWPNWYNHIYYTNTISQDLRISGSESPFFPWMWHIPPGGITPQVGNLCSVVKPLLNLPTELGVTEPQAKIKVTCRDVACMLAEMFINKGPGCTEIDHRLTEPHTWASKLHLKASALKGSSAKKKRAGGWGSLQMKTTAHTLLHCYSF